jgi:hypothetical protein
MDSPSAQLPPPTHASPLTNHRTPHQLKQIQQTRTTVTKATSEDRESSARKGCGRKIKSSLAESCSAPSPRRRVEDVNNIRLMIRCARRESWTHHQRSSLLQLTHPHSQTIAPRISSNKQNKHVQPPPAKIASPALGSDVAARPLRALLRAAVLQVPAVASKMSTTFDSVPSAKALNHGLTISAAPSSHSRIPTHKPSHPASAQTNTTNTYHGQHSHQRRSRVQRSEAMWPQDHLEPR